MHPSRSRLTLLVLAGLAMTAGFSCASGIAREGTTITVAAGGNLQAALDQAQPGDTISLAAGATFSGSFTLPAKSGNAFVTIQSSAIASLRPGERVTTASAGSMPRIVATKRGEPAIRTAPGAHHYKLLGLEVSTSRGVPVFDLVALGDGDESSAANVPHDIVIDRCYIHGLPDEGLKRAVALNSAETTIENSLILDVKAEGQDSQAIGGWNGPGPFHIRNNEISAAGENVMFGGANPAIRNLVPSDIEIRGNRFFKPRAWKGGPWSVKNLFELKSARRVVVDGNVFDTNWANAQDGFAILYNCVDTSGWARVEDVQFTNNVVRHSGSGASVSGSNPRIGCEMSNLVFRNNVWMDINRGTWGGDGRLFQILNGPAGVVIDHNYGEQTGSLLTFDGAKGPHLVFTNNIAPHNDYGVIGTGAGTGTTALKQYYATWEFAKNVIIGLPNDVSASQYPAGNFFPDRPAAVRFRPANDGFPGLLPNSPFRGAGLDGKDIGVDMAALRAAVRDWD
jgi:hypothetical protein